jgi:hypothetical protein
MDARPAPAPHPSWQRRQRRSLASLERGPRCPYIRQYQTAGVAAAKAAAQARLQDIADDLRALSAEGLSLNAMAKRLNDSDMRAPRGGSWTATAVSRALARLS